MATQGYAGYQDQYDENGNPKKAKVATSLPTLDPNAQNQQIQLTPEAKSGAAAQPDLTKLASGIAAAGATQQPSQLQQMTTQKAQEFVANPMGNFNPQQYKQQRLEKAQNDWAKAYEGLRQQYGAQSGSGLLQQNMLENALQHNTDQAALESDLDQSNYDKYLQSMAQAINAGNATNANNESIFNQRFANLATAQSLNLNEHEQEYNRLSDLVSKGLADPQTLYDYVEGIASDIKLNPAKQDAYKAEIDKEIEGEKYAFARRQAATHPEYIDPVTGKITEAGVKAYEALQAPQFDIGEVTQKDVAGLKPGDPKYQQIAASMDLIADPKTLWGAKGDAIKGTGKVIKIKDPATGKEELVTYDGTSRSAMSFTTTDGRQIVVKMPEKKSNKIQIGTKTYRI